jgi:hypothetical protein
MKTKTFYSVDQKEKTAPTNVAELLEYCRKNFPKTDLWKISLELGIVSLTLTASKPADNISKLIRHNKNPR